MIVFKKLTFANFLSVGNKPVSVDLDGCKTTLIHGTNGSGKSTILDALTYSLFGKSFRGVNLGQLINTQNKKGMLVECEFNIGNNSFLVRRGMKPKVFETFKNGEIIDAKAADKDNQAYLESHILKLTYKSFTQIVILGSSNFIPFMQLNSAGRRECVEDFLDIGVFSTMSVIAKERLRGLKDQQQTLDTEYGSVFYKIDTLEDKIKSINQRDEAEIGKYEEKIEKCRGEITTLRNIQDDYYQNVERLTHQMDELEKKGADKQAKQLNTVIIKLNTKLERLQKEKDFFEQDECPTCGQGIEYSVKTAQQGHIQKEIEKVDQAAIQAQGMLNDQQELIEEMLRLNNQMKKYNEQMFEVNIQIKSLNQELTSAEDYITSLQEMNEDTDKDQATLATLNEELSKLYKERMDMKEKISNHEVVTSLLKDNGIKTQVVKKYLPAMNKYIRHFLGELDFPIHFQLDSEFNEKVQSPLHQDFSYQSFSEGQKGRIDLSLMLTWREIGRLKNSVSTNLLILDEVFSSSLDDVGKECLLTLLRYKLPDNQRVLVVDHTLSDSFKEKFDHAVEVTRTNGFSSYV